ncbi:MAG TPA: hypothetical protein VGA87_05695, partial [Pyrinomonadaceae bacterium]
DEERGDDEGRARRVKRKKMAFHKMARMSDGAARNGRARRQNNFDSKCFRCIKTVTGDARAF